MALLCCTFSGAYVGRSVPVLTIQAGTPDEVLNLSVTAEPTTGYSDSYSDAYEGCTPTGTMQATGFIVDSIPAGHRLEIDYHERTVRLFDDADRIVGGFEVLTWFGDWDWIYATGGCDVEFCVDPDEGTQNDDTTITLAVYEEEL